jgi:hypothetical protein
MRIILLSAVMTACVFAQHRGGGPAPGIPARAPAPVGRVHNVAPPAAVRTLRPRPRTIAVPYPVYYGGGYYDAPPAAAYTEQSPGVLVNPDFRPDAVNPLLIDYSNLPAPDVDENGLRDDEPTIFLIALTDRSVVAAIAYWADGDTLNWVSRDAKQNHLSLALVDRDFSKQLNDERHVEFKLPPAK